MRLFPHSLVLFSPVPETENLYGLIVAILAATQLT